MTTIQRVFIVVSACVLGLSACAYRQVEPPPGQGTIYVLNTVAIQHAEAHSVTIDGTEIAEIRPGEFTWIHLDPGEYSVAVKGSQVQGRTLSSHDIELRHRTNREGCKAGNMPCQVIGGVQRIGRTHHIDGATAKRQ